MKIQTPGLIIKETNIGENDKLLFILTPEYGIIRAFADGVRKIKSKNSAGASLLCYSNFVIYKGKDTYKVNDIAPIELFFNLRYDLEGLSLAQYFFEMVLKLTPEDIEPSKEVLRLILNSLYFLTSGEKDKILIKAVTELRLISLSGFMPDLSLCSVCLDEKAGAPFTFSFTDGCICCKKCSGNKNNTVLVNNTVLAAMRHIIYSDFNKIFSFKIPDKDLHILSDITEKFVSIQSDYHYQTLDFYNSVKDTVYDK